MNNKTNLLEEYINFVDNTKKQNKYFKIITFLIAILIAMFLFFVLYKNLIEYWFFFTTNRQNNQSLCQFNISSKQTSRDVGVYAD